MTFASLQAGKLYVRDSPCIVEVGSKKDPLHALPHSIGRQLFRMECFSNDLEALGTFLGQAKFEIARSVFIRSLHSRSVPCQRRANAHTLGGTPPPRTPPPGLSFVLGLGNLF